MLGAFHASQNGCENKDGHHIMIKGSIQEDITIINIYAPNIGPPQYVRQILGTINGRNPDSNTIIVGDFNTPFYQWTDHPDRKLIRKHRF